MSALSELCASKGITMHATHLRFVASEQDDERWSHNEWRVVLRYQGRRLTAPFRTGVAISEPSVADVVSSLVFDSLDWGSFEDFCADLGYDPDSRKAEKIYKACKKTGPKVRKLLGRDFDAFAGAEH